MDRNVVVVSGTSSGIGLQVALVAARAGRLVVATMRDVGREGALRSAAEAAGVTDSIVVRPMDVTDDASVDALVESVVAEYGRLDAVVNNAGAGHLGTLELESIDAIREVFDLNFFGVLRLTKAALPHLRATGGRIVTVTSVGGIVGQPFNEAYCAAKFAVEGFMESLHPVAKAVGVSVTVVEPGAVASEFVRNVKTDPARLIETAGVYAAALQGYLQHVRGSFAQPQDAAGAAAFVCEALTADDPPFRVQTSEAARAFVASKIADLDGSAVTRMTESWLG
jgi:NAD(P)-dependent dehydrogenase (short-subunit alcohol dehydrogenase family)